MYLSPLTSTCHTGCVPFPLHGLTWFSIPDRARGASTPAARLCWGSVIALFFLCFNHLGLSIVALCGTDVPQAAAPCCGYQEPHVPHSVTLSHGTLRDSSCGTSPHTPCPPWLPPAPNPLHSYSSSCRGVQGSRFHSCQQRSSEPKGKHQAYGGCSHSAGFGSRGWTCSS